MSTAFAWFTLAGPQGELEGELAYYSESPCEPEGLSCYHWHFTPFDPLTTGLYTAEMFGVTDRAGLGLDGPYPWSFEVTDGIGSGAALGRAGRARGARGTAGRRRRGCGSAGRAAGSAGR